MDNQITRELLIIKSFYNIYLSDNYSFKDWIIKIKGLILENELKIRPSAILDLENP